jgi:hypothetical protein
VVLFRIALNADSVRRSTPACQNLLIGFKPKRQEPEKASTMVENYRRRGIDR